MAEPRRSSSGSSSKKTSSAKTSSSKSSSSRSGSHYSGSSSRSSSSGSYNIKLFKKKNGKWTLNWPVIIAFAVLMSVYLIITLFNGRDTDQWQEGWQDLQSNVASSVSGLTDELQSSVSSDESASSGSSAEPSDAPVVTETAEVRVHFIDVGQGDSILIENGSEAVLIDAGENDKGGIVSSYLSDLGIEKLDIAVGTHPHSDHIGGLDTVLKNIPADEVWQPDIPEKVTPTTRTFKDLLDAIDTCGAKDYIVGPGDTVNICGGTLDVLGPVKGYDDLNDLSLVMKFTYGEKTFLFTGDMEKPAEADLIASGADLDADVLKMGHHGSSTSSGNAFLDLVSADVYVILCGENNDYGHPHREIRDFLKEENAENWRTDLNGHIVMTCDGKTIKTVSQK